MSDLRDAAGAPTPDSLRILLEASQVAAEYSLDLDDLLEALGGLIRKLVDYQLFAFLLTEENQDLSIRYSIGYRPELVRTLRVESGRGITVHAAVERRTIVSNDVRNDDRYLMALDAVRSEMSVPLVARGRLVGVIDLQSSLQDAFGDREGELVERIGSRFSLAIDAAQLYESTVRTNQTLHLLGEMSRDFSNILELEELLKSVAAVVRRLMPYDAFSIYLQEEGAGKLKHYFGARYDERVQWGSMGFDEGVVGHAATLRQPVLVRDTDEDVHYVPAVEGIRSEVAVPLILKERLIGILDIESERVVHEGPRKHTHSAGASDRLRDREREVVRARSGQRASHARRPSRGAETPAAFIARGVSEGRRPRDRRAKLRGNGGFRRPLRFLRVARGRSVCL